MSTQPRPIVGVIGSGTERHEALASEVGRLLADLDVHVLTGGGQGVMAAVSDAFAAVPNRKGLVIGILPCQESDPLCRPKPGYPNPSVEIPIPTHLPLSGTQGTEPMSRNHINVLASHALIALPGGAGTASEALLAMKYKRPIVAYLGRDGAIPGLHANVRIVRSIDEVADFLRHALRRA